MKSGFYPLNQLCHFKFCLLNQVRMVHTFYLFGATFCFHCVECLLHKLVTYHEGLGSKDKGIILHVKAAHEKTLNPHPQSRTAHISKSLARLLFVPALEQIVSSVKHQMMLLACIRDHVVQKTQILKL